MEICDWQWQNTLHRENEKSVWITRIRRSTIGRQWTIAYKSQKNYHRLITRRKYIFNGISHFSYSKQPISRQASRPRIAVLECQSVTMAHVREPDGRRWDTGGAVWRKSGKYCFGRRSPGCRTCRLPVRVSAVFGYSYNSWISSSVTGGRRTAPVTPSRGWHPNEITFLRLNLQNLQRKNTWQTTLEGREGGSGDDE